MHRQNRSLRMKFIPLSNFSAYIGHSRDPRYTLGPVPKGAGPNIKHSADRRNIAVSQLT